MKTYYLRNGLDLKGPFTVTELKLRNVSFNDERWQQESKTRTRAGEVEELKALFNSSTPSPFTTSQVYHFSNASTHLRETAAHPPMKYKSSIANTVSLFVIIVAFAIGGVYAFEHIKGQKMMSGSRDEVAMKPGILSLKETSVIPADRIVHVNKTSPAVVTDNAAMTRKNLFYLVRAEHSDYTLGIVRGIYDIKISVINTTAYTMDHVKVKVTYFKANGHPHKVAYLNFKNLKARSKTTMKAPDSSRGRKVEYKMLSVKSAALGLL